MRRSLILGAAAALGAGALLASLPMPVETSCAWKPRPSASCTLVDGGDPGVRNTLQPGEWAGPGCVPKPCRVLAGQREP